jgi:alkanesulfonate monooxygenase
MTLEFVWTLPTRGDGRPAVLARRPRGDFNPQHAAKFAPSVTDDRPGRYTYFDYLTQVARAAELAGFDAITIPYDPQGEESWIAATALARETPRLGIIPEFQPGFSTAVYAAKLALSFQRFFDNRLGWRLALDADPLAQRSVGDHVVGDDRVRRAEELLVIAQGIWNESPFDFHGEFFEVEGGGFFDPTPNEAVLGGQGIARRPFPTVYLSGTSNAEIDLSARFADVHLFDVARPDELHAAIEQHRAKAEALGREVRYGVRLGVFARDTSAEAWRRLGRAWDQVSPIGASEIARQRSDDNLWHGFRGIGFGAPSGVVGSYDEVADRLASYASLGVTSFVLEGTPSLEEGYRLGEYLLPLVRRTVGPVSARAVPAAV